MKLSKVKVCKFYGQRSLQSLQSLQTDGKRWGMEKNVLMPFVSLIKHNKSRARLPDQEEVREQEGG
jgi:hypothetical protein